MSQFVICDNMMCDSFILIRLILSNKWFQSPMRLMSKSPLGLIVYVCSETILAETMPYSLCFRASATPIHKALIDEHSYN